MDKTLLFLVTILFLSLSISSCDDDSEAQQTGTQFTAAFSGMRPL